MGLSAELEESEVELQSTSEFAVPRPKARTPAVFQWIAQVASLCWSEMSALPDPRLCIIGDIHG